MSKIEDAEIEDAEIALSNAARRLAGEIGNLGYWQVLAWRDATDEDVFKRDLRQHCTTMQRFLEDIKA